MKMPASFAEFSDALQKARIKDGSFCKNELTCIHYNGLTHAMIGWNANLYDLNLFAQRLASLTEEQKKGMDALLKIKQNHRVAPIPLNQLINLTYNTDICCFAPRVSNHEELGAFLYANEMLSNEAMALLDTTEEGSGFQERLLELLGEQHQEDHGGVFTDFGYAELGGEIKDIYVCQSNETACFHRSDAPVMLEVRKGFFNDPSYDNDKTAVLNLPAADAGIWRAVEKVDAASVDECAFRCVDCLIPFLRDAINNAIITTAYLRNEDIQTAVEENIDYLNPPVRSVFVEFLTRIKLVDPDVDAALQDMGTKIDNAVFREWVAALLTCRHDRGLKTILTPIVAKLSDMRIVNGELENLVFEPRKEFITMQVLVIGNIPLLYWLNQDWYDVLMHTPLGQALLAAIAAVMFISTAAVIKLTQPIEYRR